MFRLNERDVTHVTGVTISRTTCIAIYTGTVLCIFHCYICYMCYIEVRETK
jgi:hypothetical protein